MPVTGGTVGTGSAVGGVGIGSTGGHCGPGLVEDFQEYSVVK